jgi:acetyl-CoA carboxylase carboxyl transferase subunit alpha
MLQYSTYFVISPEGCANIIWKSSEFAPDAAAAMGVTSSVLQDLGIVDAAIPEPMGGAHRDIDGMASKIKSHIESELARLRSKSIEELLSARYDRLLSIGN